jgi:cytochrome P450
MTISENDLKLPQGVELTSIDEVFRADPYKVLQHLRQFAPVLHDRELHRFVYTSHDHVKSILRDKHFYSDPRKANPGTYAREFLGSNIGADGEPSMLLMDEPGHRRLRSLVSAPFTPHAVERWRPHIRDIVETTLDSIATPQFDLIEAFAGPVPTVVIAEMLGLDPVLYPQFKQWSDLAIQIAFNPFPSEEQTRQGDAATASLDDVFTAAIANRLDHPGDDLISDMIRAEAEGETLSVDEIVNQCNLLLIAGNVTTTDLIANGIKALLDHPDQLRKLCDAPELIGNAVEEMLRFDSPVTNSGRITNREIDLGACPVHKGESLSVSLAAANRDPSVYDDPDRFDIEREDTHHQSFGGGRHLCLGAHLARIEAQEAILGILARYPGLEHGDKGFVYHAVPGFRGMSEFWVRGMPAVR